MARRQLQINMPPEFSGERSFSSNNSPGRSVSSSANPHRHSLAPGPVNDFVSGRVERGGLEGHDPSSGSLLHTAHESLPDDKSSGLLLLGVLSLIAVAALVALVFWLIVSLHTTHAHTKAHEQNEEHSMAQTEDSYEVTNRGLLTAKMSAEMRNYGSRRHRSITDPSKPQVFLGCWLAAHRPAPTITQPSAGSLCRHSGQGLGHVSRTNRSSCGLKSWMGSEWLTSLQKATGGVLGGVEVPGHQIYAQQPARRSKQMGNATPVGPSIRKEPAAWFYFRGASFHPLPSGLAGCGLSVGTGGRKSERASRA